MHAFGKQNIVAEKMKRNKEKIIQQKWVKEKKRKKRKSKVSSKHKIKCHSQAKCVSNHNNYKYFKHTL